jgi:Tfp pilus assembly protein PilN
MRGGAEVMSAPVLAQVNLLPHEVREARTLGVVRRWIFASTGVTAVAVVTIVAVAHVQTSIAGSELAQAQAETTALLTQQRPYAEVNTVRTELESARAARAYALADEILWSDYLGALVAVTPDGVGIASMDYHGTTPLTSAPPSTDPLVDAGVGTLTFTAFARDVPDTAAWADALEGVPGFDDPRIDAVSLAEAAVGGRAYEVTGTVQLDDAAFSHRFDPSPEERS